MPHRNHSPKGTPVAVRFWKYVLKGDGCWEWQGAKVPTSGNCGVLRINGRNVFAPRVSWELHFGPIPDGLKVLHKCDNPPCVRPDHLFLGTDADNSADMVAKGRQTKGAAQHLAKLTEDQVREIRALPFTGYGFYSKTARKYGITEATFRAVYFRWSWKHVL